MAETVLTLEDNGKSIEAAMGASLSVRLEESPTTGYMWANKTLGDVLLLEDSDYSPASPSQVGGRGMRTLRFRVGKPGTARLTLKLMREWEGEPSAVKVFSVEIRATQR